MIDLWNPRFIVKGIEYDEENPDIKYHVMEKGPKYHSNSRYYIDEDGNEYLWECCSFRRTDDNQVEYLVEFEDLELSLPKGTVLHFPKEDWIKDIPDSKVVCIEYKATNEQFVFDDKNNLCIEVYDGTKIVVNETGEVIISKPASIFMKHVREAIFSVPVEKAEALFKKMLRCVSEVDCYREIWSDDTARAMVFHFANGETLEYGGTFHHNDVHTVGIISDFLKECEEITAFKFQVLTEKKEQEKSNNYIKKKKEMVFPSVDSLQQVVNVVNEAACALNDKSRTIRESAIPEVLGGALGAGIGGVGSFAALYGLGTVGLSAAGITSGLATAGALVGGGMVAGVFVLAAPVAAMAAGGVGMASHLKNKQLRQEKERLYTEALKKHEAIIKALKEEADTDKERLDYLQSLNILLTQAIKDLKKDLGVA